VADNAALPGAKAEDLKGHGTNERISIANYVD
jgi:hypothetical protein